MYRMGRHVFSELTPGRLLLALKVRVAEIPHAFAWRFNDEGRTNREHLQRFKRRHAGDRCFIVANGPSLAGTNLDLLSNERTFGLNRIYLNFARSSFRPTYYMAVNELILEQFAAEISDLPMPKFLNWNRRSHYCPPTASTMYLKSKMVVADSFQRELTRAVVVGATVTFVALQMAYYMGFTTAVIVGLDHRYAEKGSPSRLEVRTSERDQSHFDPRYFPKGVKWQLPDLLRSEIDFGLAREAFEEDGREILDATIDGGCNVFKKVDYSTLF